ncbi:MAG TPA: thiamine phosphate synthase [Magnetospirillaceae bacterium]|jgi:thiamine-phosphate pyrophosphorylase
MTNLAERARRLNPGMRTGFALMTDHKRLPDPLPLLPLLPPGSLVILRHYDTPERATLARALRKACRARRLILLIADDFDLAVAFDAGLHLPEGRARNAGARIRLWHRRTKAKLSVAAHSRIAVRRAAQLGADITLLSPVFATASHPDAVPLGIARFRALVRGARIPIWALGGVTGRTLRMLANSGAAGIATVGNLTHD